MNRLTYTVEDAMTGRVATANRDEQEAREAGETLVEFDPEHEYVLVTHTLH